MRHGTPLRRPRPGSSRQWAERQRRYDYQLLRFAPCGLVLGLLRRFLACALVLAREDLAVAMTSSIPDLPGTRMSKEYTRQPCSISSSPSGTGDVGGALMLARAVRCASAGETFARAGSSEAAVPFLGWIEHGISAAEAVIEVRRIVNAASRFMIAPFLSNRSGICSMQRGQ